MKIGSKNLVAPRFSRRRCIEGLRNFEEQWQATMLMSSRRRILLVIFAAAIFIVGARAVFRIYPSEIVVLPHGDASIGAAESSKSTANGSVPLLANQASAKTAGRAVVPQMLPPPGTPLKETLDLLKSRANAGDAQAASRLFRDMQRCARSRMINQTYPEIADLMLKFNASGTSPQSMDAGLEIIQQQLAFAARHAALCADLSDGDLAQALPSTLQAARLGDELAASCYVATGFMPPPPRLLDHPEWLTDYKNNALGIAQSGIVGGDWGMVRQLQLAYSGKDIGLLSQVTGIDTVQSYRYLKLQQLGAAPGSSDVYLERQLARAASEIGPKAQLDSDAWAHKAYQLYFNSVTPPAEVDARRTCASSDF